MKQFKKMHMCKRVSILVILTLIISIFVFPQTTYAASKKNHLRKTSITLTYGSTYQQKLISASGKTITATSVTWKSNDTSIAKINKNGTVSTVKAGTTKMTAKYKGKTYTFSVKVKNPTLRATKKTLKCGDSYTQKLYNASKNIISTSSIKFSSSNTKVATVSSKGVIKAKKPGTATISLKYKGKTFKSTITVKSRLSLSSTKVTFDEFKTKSITISTDSKVESISYDIQGNENISCSWGKWDGNDIKLKIKPLYLGTTKIKITYEGKGSSYDSKVISVSVKQPVTDISVRQSETMMKGDTVSLTATLYPSDAYNKTVTWTSSNKAVATVDKKGNVKAIGVGTCTITAKSHNGLTAKCDVQVLDASLRMETNLPNVFYYVIGNRTYTKTYVNDYRVSFEPYFSTGNIKLNVELDAEKIYDIYGDDDDNSCYVTYRLYDTNTSNLIKTGHFSMLYVVNGDTFVMKVEINNIPCGDYYMVLDDRT